MTDHKPKPHPLVFGLHGEGNMASIVASLQGANLDVEKLYEHFDARRRGQTTDDLRHADYCLMAMTELTRYLVAELHYVEGKLPPEQRQERCPMCGHTSWDRPLKSDPSGLDVTHDFSRRSCRCCGHERPEPEPQPEPDEAKETP